MYEWTLRAHAHEGVDWKEYTLTRWRRAPGAEREDLRVWNAVIQKKEPRPSSSSS